MWVHTSLWRCLWPVHYWWRVDSDSVTGDMSQVCDLAACRARYRLHRHTWEKGRKKRMHSALVCVCVWQRISTQHSTIEQHTTHEYKMPHTTHEYCTPHKNWLSSSLHHGLLLLCQGHAPHVGQVSRLLHLQRAVPHRARTTQYNAICHWTKQHRTK